MANRHLSRSIVLQTLFEWDFSDGKNSDIAAKSAEGGSPDASMEAVREILERNTKEFGSGVEDTDFVKSLLDTVFNKQKIIDEVITKSAPDWPLEKISIIDRNILRIGLAELIFGNRSEVPPKVAINEAIELAKAFGGENSSKFVNGVLGAVYKEMGEPGKDEQSKKKETGPIDLTKLPIEKLGGAVVYAKKDDQIYLAFVHDVFGYWTLSKGHIEAGENEQEGTIREIKEEMGLDMVIKNELGQNEYVASNPEKGKIRKQVYYFLAEAPFQELKLGTSGGLDDARWFRLADIVDLKMYDDIIPIITKAIDILTKN